MDSMFLLMDLLVFGCGAYILYAYFLMVKKGEIKESILMSKEVKFVNCKDKEGYIGYVAPKLLIFGIGALLCGALGFLNDYTQLLGGWYLLITLIFLVLIVWFAMTTKKAVKKFW